MYTHRSHRDFSSSTEARKGSCRKWPAKECRQSQEVEDGSVPQRPAHLRIKVAGGAVLVVNVICLLSVCSCAVSDTGIGPPNRTAEAFQQAEGSVGGRRHGGTGLGSRYQSRAGLELWAARFRLTSVSDREHVWPPAAAPIAAESSVEQAALPCWIRACCPSRSTAPAPDPRRSHSVRVLGQRGVPGFKVRRYRIVRDGPPRCASVGTTCIRRRRRSSVGSKDTSGDEPAPKDDPHPEYVADELLIVTQGPDSDDAERGGEQESREPGRFRGGRLDRGSGHAVLQNTRRNGRRESRQTRETKEKSRALAEVTHQGLTRRTT